MKVYIGSIEFTTHTNYLYITSSFLCTSFEEQGGYSLRSLLLLLCVIPLHFLYSSCEEQGGCCTRYTHYDYVRTYLLVPTVLLQYQYLQYQYTVDYSETQSPHNFPISKCFSSFSFPSHHGIVHRLHCQEDTNVVCAWMKAACKVVTVNR